MKSFHYLWCSLSLRDPTPFPPIPPSSALVIFTNVSFGTVLMPWLSPAKPKINFIPILALWNEAIKLVHRHRSVPGNALLRTVTETGLIPSASSQRPTVRPCFMCLHGSFRCNPTRMFHHRYPVRIRRIILCPQHKPRNLIERIAWLPAFVWLSAGLAST